MFLLKPPTPKEAPARPKIKVPPKKGRMGPESSTKVHSYLLYCMPVMDESAVFGEVHQQPGSQQKLLLFGSEVQSFTLQE